MVLASSTSSASQSLYYAKVRYKKDWATVFTTSQLQSNHKNTSYHSVILRHVDGLLAALDLDILVRSTGPRSLVLLFLDARSSLVVTLGDCQRQDIQQGARLTLICDSLSRASRRSSSGGRLSTSDSMDRLRGRGIISSCWRASAYCQLLGASARHLDTTLPFERYMK